MSKLYNTLEQIRKQETHQVAATGKTPGAKGKSPRYRGKVLGLLVAATVAAAILLYLALPRLAGLPPDIPGAQTPVADKSAGAKPASNLPAGMTQGNQNTAGSLARPAPGAGTEKTPEQEFISLNNQGAEYVRKQDYWQGLYFFAKARKLQPNRVEPLINSAVALAELGLTELALHYLNQVAELEPANPMLRANLEILAKAGMGDLKIEN